jgi:uncharacterized membrane protein
MTEIYSGALTGMYTMLWLKMNVFQYSTKYFLKMYVYLQLVLPDSYNE